MKEPKLREGKRLFQSYHRKSVAELELEIMPSSKATVSEAPPGGPRGSGVTVLMPAGWVCASGAGSKFILTLYLDWDLHLSPLI